VGDLTDLSNFIRFAAGQQADFVATLPVLASFLDNPFDPSPYAPVSRLFWNELYVDPAVPPGNGAGLRDWPRLASLLNDEDLVPYRAAMALKRQAMDWQAGNFIASDNGRAQLEAFLDSKPSARDYARFRAAVERLGPNWRDWPVKQRSGKLTAQDYDPAPSITTLCPVARGHTAALGGDRRPNQKRQPLPGLAYRCARLWL
jgi:4-alpha-glucanotransferase